MGLFGKKPQLPPPPKPIPAPTPPSISEIIFKMRFTSKMLGREAGKSQKKVEVEQKKAKDALARNNIPLARMHAENSIRLESESLSYLKLQAQLEAVSSKLNTMQARQQVTDAMVATTGNLDAVLNGMDPTKIGYAMQKFVQQNEQMDFTGLVMDSAMSQTTQSGLPQGQVNELLQRIADENFLDVRHHIWEHQAPIVSAQPPAVQQGQQAQQAQLLGDSDLEAKLGSLPKR